jgi:Sugar-tranasporters, 12 TM
MTVMLSTIAKDEIIYQSNKIQANKTTIYTETPIKDRHSLVQLSGKQLINMVEKATIAFTIIYALGALSTKSNLLQILFLCRILTGIGTSLLFSAPESWLVGEAQKKVKNESGEEVNNMAYLGDTFGMAYAGDSIVAKSCRSNGGSCCQSTWTDGSF